VIAELIFTLLPWSNAPVYMHEPGPPYIRTEVTLELTSQMTEKFSLRLAPYIRKSGMFRGSGTGGAEVEIMFKAWDNFDVGVYHHSRQNFNNYGHYIEQDGIRARWR